MITLRRFFTVFVVATLALAATCSYAFEAPRGEVVLTVSGQLDTTNSNGFAKFDLAMLRKLGGTTIKTSTRWTAGQQTFVGVELSKLLGFLGIKRGTLRASAINDYSVDIPVSDAVEGGPIIAYSLNGMTMSIREKGPLWIIYPYDSKEEYQTEKVYSRSIWQLERIKVVP